MSRTVVCMKKGSADTVYQKELHKHGLAVTKQRLALLHVLDKTTEPLSIEKMLKLAQEKMNLTTGYRVIQTLLQAGLVREVRLGGERALFESTRSHHHHVVCKTCKRVQDVPICLPKSSYGRALSSARMFDRIEEHAIEFFGICTPCTQKRSS